MRAKTEAFEVGIPAGVEAFTHVGEVLRDLGLETKV